MGKNKGKKPNKPFKPPSENGALHDANAPNANANTNANSPSSSKASPSHAQKGPSPPINKHTPPPAGSTAPTRSQSKSKPSALVVYVRKHPNVMYAMGAALVVVLVLSNFVLAYFSSYRVSRPYPLPPLADTSTTRADVDAERFWGTYRSQAYFGLRTRSEAPLLAGVMWFEHTVLPGQKLGVKHYCEHSDKQRYTSQWLYSMAFLHSNSFIFSFYLEISILFPASSIRSTENYLKLHNPSQYSPKL